MLETNSSPSPYFKGISILLTLKTEATNYSALAASSMKFLGIILEYMEALGEKKKEALQAILEDKDKDIDFNVSIVCSDFAWKAKKAANCSALAASSMTFLDIILEYMEALDEKKKEALEAIGEDKVKDIAINASIVCSDFAGKAKNAADEADKLFETNWKEISKLGPLQQQRINDVVQEIKVSARIAKKAANDALHVSFLIFAGEGEVSRYEEAKKKYKQELKEEAPVFSIALSGGKRKTKDKNKKDAKKPVVSQKKQSIYKEILRKQMKIYKMPDSRKEYVKYKGELLHISDYKSLIMKQKANAKPKAIAKAKPKK